MAGDWRVRATRRECQKGLNLFAGYAEFFHQLVTAHVLKVLRYRRDRHPGAFKHPRAAALAGNAFDGGALCPIKSCHVPAATREL